MKRTDGFDARRLRPRGQTSWRLRFGAAFGVLLATIGLLFTLLGLLSLFSSTNALGELAAGRDAALVLSVLGLAVMLTGLYLWRRARRRLRASGDLSLPRHLLRKRG